MNIEMTTELGAVNTLLQTINESPVNSLETTGLSDVSMARNTLIETSREVQSQGWDFNTEEITLVPDVDGYINIPSNVIKLDPVDLTKRYVQRGTKLYDKDNNTFVIAASVKVEVIYFLNFEEIPETARRYITIKAARRFQNRVLGDEAVYMYTREDENEAKLAFMEQEIESGEYNMGRDSATMSAATMRYGY